MSTERLDDLYIRQPAPVAGDAFLPLRLFASLLVGLVAANLAVAAVLGVGFTAIPSSGPGSGETAIGGAAAIVVLALPFFLIAWGFVSTAAWYLFRRDVPCIAAIVVSLSWLAFGA
jgi:hypothetical protein